MKLNPSKLFSRFLYRLIFSIVSLLSFCFILPSNAAADDEAEIRETFVALQQALNAHNGNQALALLSSDTKDYYRMLSSLAAGNTSLKKLESAQLTPLNLMMLKYTKKAFPKSFWNDVNKSNPDKLLKMAVEKGLGSKELTDNIQLGKIELSGQSANGKLLKGPKVLPTQLGFQKESGQWKVSLLSMFEEANKLAENFLKKTGLKIEDLEKLVLQ